MSSGSLQDLRRAIYVRAKAEPSVALMFVLATSCKPGNACGRLSISKRNNGAGSESRSPAKKGEWTSSSAADRVGRPEQRDTLRTRVDCRKTS